MNGAFVLAGRLVWRLRFDLLAVLVVAAVMTLATDRLSLQSLSPLVPLMGIVVSIFIGFRNRNAYNRWWEARTLWSSIVANSRSLNYALMAYMDGTPEMAAVIDRMRRREVRHAWRLADELHDNTTPSARLSELTPEDPAATSSVQLLTRQAADIAEMSRNGMIDRQARRVLVTINSSQVAAAIGLERVRRQLIPRFYELFIRGLAWFFAVLVCTRFGAGGHDAVAGIVVGIVIMALLVVAERLGYLLDQPMSDDAFGLPLEKFCSELASDLLGPRPMSEAK